MNRPISRAQYEALFPGRVPTAQDVEAVINRAAGDAEFNRVYGAILRETGDHEAAVRATQQALGRRYVSDNPEPINAANLAAAGITPPPEVGPGINRAILEALALRSSAPLPPVTPVTASAPASYEQLALALRSRTPAGKFASPTKVSNPRTPEELAAANSPRVFDMEAPAAAAVSPGQLALDFSAPDPAAIKAVVEQAASEEPSWSEQGMRLAGRYGLPALAALGGFTLLAAATDTSRPRVSAPQEQQEPGPAVG